MEKLKMHSPDLTQQNVARIAELFPSCVTEALSEDGKTCQVIDFDLLRQELSFAMVEGRTERYELNWPGRQEAMLLANSKIAKTLRPIREESVEFDTTQNLFVEGDNLDALKLLQENYLGRVKVIYIDPPYNTRNDFIYNDDFTIDSHAFFLRSNQIDQDSNRLVSNSEANGRFHSDWLSMIFPRLKLARNMLSEDGVILISIDDNESANLRKICDFVFGATNFLGTVVWKNATDNNPSNIATEHESILVYAKSREHVDGVWKSDFSDVRDRLVAVGKDFVEKFPDANELQAVYTQWFRDNKNSLGKLDRYKYIDAGGVYTGSQSVHNPGREGYRYDVIHEKTGKPCKQPLMGYRFPKSTMERLLDSKRIIFGDDHNKVIELKVYAEEFVDKLASVFELDGRLGAYDLKDLFPEIKKVFTNPKPVGLLTHLLSFATKPQDIVLDFFGGSATTAHAVLQLNAKDSGKRRFILVQLPEICDENTEAAQAGFATIAEISKERIRRVGKNIKAESSTRAPNLDVGFRVLKIDTSNMKEVFYQPDATKQGDLFSFVDNIKGDRTSEDLLFQVLLDWGVDLCLSIACESIFGHEVFFVDGNALAACFEKDLSEETIKGIASRKPRRAVFRDTSFANDSAKINIEQVFKYHSPGTDLKCI